MRLRSSLLSCPRWVLHQLISVCGLVSENVRRLLDSLSNATQKARATAKQVASELCKLLLAHSPVAVCKAMVDFNRWIIEVLADTRSEGIQWEPSYGENPWLALEEQPQHSSVEEGAAASEENTMDVLEDTLEFYMTRYDSLLETNSSLSTQVAELKAQISDALACAFESQRFLERQSELFELQYRRLVVGVQFGDFIARETHPDEPEDVVVQISRAFESVDVFNNGFPTRFDEASTVDSESEHDNESIQGVPSLRAEDRDEALDVETSDAPVNRDERLAAEVVSEEKLPQEEATKGPSPTKVSKDEQFLLEVMSDDTLPSKVQPAQKTIASPASLVPTPGGVSFQQLATLRTNEEDNGSWLHQTLQVLQEERKQRRRQDTSLESTTVSSSSEEAMSLSRCAHPEMLEFEQLIAMRGTSDGEDGANWYRNALRYLKEERQRRSSLHSRTESFSSTITMVD